MTRIAPLLVTVVAAALLVVACSADDAVTAPVVDLAADADGATVYQARCASCHGVDLRGTDKGPSQLSIVYEPGHHSDYAYRLAIRNGTPQHHWSFGPMAPVAKITDDQIEAVIAYIRGEQQRLGFER